ncbi:MAG TPA: hypothetical protein PLD10_22220 [Rhodopila sp.]|nr:hypothetical protein [Rhodopila sp.]
MIDWDGLVIGPCVANVFGEAVTYTYANGAPVNMTGVFDEQYLGLEPADGQTVTTAMPVLGVQMSQFPAPPQQGDTVLILRTGNRYIVREVRPDGHGAAKLMLNQA